MHKNPPHHLERHPIGVVAERTGLSPEILRAWERRYGVVEPQRRPGGQRMYSDSDVERLMLLRQATQGGRSIGGVADLPIDALAELVREDRQARIDLGAQDDEPETRLDIDEAVARARALDSERLEQMLRRVATLVGMPRFLESSAAPFLQRVGSDWHDGRLTVAQEHLATATLQRVLLPALDTLSAPQGAPTILIAGPAGERHGMGGVLAAAAAASERWRVLYLGPDLPAAEIANAARSSRADVVALSVIFVDDPARTVHEIETVRRLLPSTIPIILGGAAAPALRDSIDTATIEVTESLRALRESLRAWAGRDSD